MLYSDFKSQVIWDTALTDAFSVTMGVKQGCILSPFLFILGIDWVLRQVTSGVRKGIRWTLTSVLEDLDYADDILDCSPTDTTTCRIRPMPWQLQQGTSPEDQH